MEVYILNVSRPSAYRRREEEDDDVFIVLLINAEIAPKVGQLDVYIR